MQFRFFFVVHAVIGFALTGPPPGAVFGQDLGEILGRSARDLLKEKQNAVREQFQPREMGRNLREEVVPALRDPRRQSGQGGAGAGAVSGGEFFPLNTADGWTLVIHHYPPARGSASAGASVGAGGSRSAPIVLCHGLGYNAQFFDLEPSVSLAQDLSRRGYDVWALSLRGSGLSRKWVRRLEDAPNVLLGEAVRRLTKGKLAPTGYASLDPRYANWTMDDHILYDVPAAVAFVRQRTRSSEVTWLGHSMGGIVALGHLAQGKNAGIGRLIVVGSQVTMPKNQVILQFLGESLKVRDLMLKQVVGVYDMESHVKTSVNNLFFNERHTPQEVYEALSTWARDMPSVGLLNQYRIMGERGELFDAKGKVSYFRMMDRVKIPVLIAGGAADQLAPPTVQRILYDAVGSADKNLLILGRRNGFAADSGHNDSLVGTTSAAQFYPLIDQWLQGRRFAAPASAPAPTSHSGIGSGS